MLTIVSLHTMYDWCFLPPISSSRFDAVRTIQRCDLAEKILLPQKWWNKSWSVQLDVGALGDRVASRLVLLPVQSNDESECMLGSIVWWDANPSISSWRNGQSTELSAAARTLCGDVVELLGTRRVVWVRFSARYQHAALLTHVNPTWYCLKSNTSNRRRNSRATTFVRFVTQILLCYRGNSHQTTCQGAANLSYCRSFCLQAIFSFARCSGRRVFWRSFVAMRLYLREIGKCNPANMWVLCVERDEASIVAWAVDVQCLSWRRMEKGCRIMGNHRLRDLLVWSTSGSFFEGPRQSRFEGI